MSIVSLPVVPGLVAFRAVGAPTTLAVPADKLFLTPFRAHGTLRIDAIGVNLTTAGTGTATPSSVSTVIDRAGRTSSLSSSPRWHSPEPLVPSS